MSAYYSYQYFLNDDLVLNKKISVKHIISTEMSKTVYSRDATPNIKFIEILLTDEQINSIAEWINSVPDSSIVEVKQVPSKISAGIIFRLKFNKEVRIQYDLEKIYITRNDAKNIQVKYSITQEDLKKFFDEQLKGFYFGNDTVN